MFFGKIFKVLAFLINYFGKLNQMGENFGRKTYIWLVYGGKGVAGQFGFVKMYWKFVFISGFTPFFSVKILVWYLSWLNFLNLESSEWIFLRRWNIQ